MSPWALFHLFVPPALPRQLFTSLLNSFMFQKAKSAASSAASAAASKAALVANEQATKARTTIDAEMPKYQAQFAAASEQ